MKTRFFFLAVLALAAMACTGNSSNDNMALAVGSSSIDYRTDWALYGLLGPVESVTYENGDRKDVYTFNTKGKLIENSVERTRFKGRVRTDETTYMTIINYTFDELGRVVSEAASDYNGTYEYEGDAYYPVKTAFAYYEPGDEEVEPEVHTFEYSPKDFDSHGNWLVRKNNGEKQKRVITYHADPYDLGKDPQFKTPKDVVDAMLKAEKKKDAVAYLQTYEYSTRKQMEMEPETVQKRYDSQKEDFDIRSYRITEVGEKDSRGLCEVTAEILRGNGNQEVWHYSVYQADNGFWYNAGLAYGK